MSPHEPTRDDDKPPVFSTWARLYAAVLSYLGLCILLMYTFMRVFS